MEITTSRFAAISYEQKDIITFDDGLLGFEKLTKFTIIDSNDGTSILWLQSLENGEIAFPLLEPKIFKPDYQVCATDKDLLSIGIEDLNKSEVYSILTIPEDITKMNANLKAPVIINPDNQKAKQTVLKDSKLPVDLDIYPALKAYLLKESDEDPARDNSKPAPEVSA